MSKFDYEELGQLIIDNGLELAISRFFSDEGEEGFAEQVALLEK